MRWSKLKSEIGHRIVEPLQSRVSFHFTKYRENKSNFQGRDYGRFWITIDKIEVFSQDCRQFFDKNDSVTSDSIESYRRLREYLSLDIRTAQMSSDPITKALAIIDTRTGVRTLKRIDVTDEHELVQCFYRLRIGLKEITKLQA